MKPLFPFRATTIPRAFFLNAISLGLCIALTSFCGDLVRDAGWSSSSKLITQVAVSTLSLYATFWTLRWLFGYGGGQLAAAAP